MTRLPRPIALTGALVPLALVLAACGSDGEEFSEDALVVYSGRQEALVEGILDRFQQESDIAVEVRYGDTAELSAQLIEEGDRSPADLFFSQDGGALGALAKRDRLAALPNAVLRRIDERFRADDGTWVGVSGRARVIVYDPAQVPAAELPDSVFELTEPQWKGRVGIAPTNASFQAFVTAIRVLQGDDAARAWLKGMVANDVQTFDNNLLVLDAANEGVISIGLINHYYWYELVAEEGRDAVSARLKFPKNAGPESLVNVAGVGVLESADKRDQAEQLAEFLLSTEAQQYFADETKEYPLIDGVATAEGVPPLDSLNPPNIDLADLDTLEETLDLIEEAGLT